MSHLISTTTSARGSRVPVAMILLVLLCAGCSGSAGPKLAKVTGTVTLDGKPVQGAVLEFIPQEPGKSTAWGKTDETGYYEMAFGQSRKGAFLGRMLVRIISDDRVFIDGKEYVRTELFPPRYNAKSELFVEVEDRANEFNFKCESGSFKPRQAKSGGAS